MSINLLCHLQAWGLMELQRGNFPIAVMLLERSVAFDPSFSPVYIPKYVLRWQQVIEARNAITAHLAPTSAMLWCSRYASELPWVNLIRDIRASKKIVAIHRCHSYRR